MRLEHAGSGQERQLQKCDEPLTKASGSPL